MIHRMDDYIDIVGDKAVAELYRKTSVLRNRHIIHVNSTHQGGGVAEILHSLLPLLNEIGIDAGWRIVHGNPNFFTVTKKFHNSLQGESLNLTMKKKNLYYETNESFACYTHLDHDCVIIHDPQPLPLVNFFKKVQPWIWRCHIDLSHPDKHLWSYLKRFILKYDLVVVSSEKYKKEDLPVEQVIIPPAIDPLSLKNKDLSQKDINRYLKKFMVPTDKPLITQISRFDKWKDPVGVIEIFKLVKEEVDCRLILCGSMASDDPEGNKIYDIVKRKANKLLDDNDIVLITVENDILVNLLQRTSDVIIQKSLKEGFGLTVTEAMWKGKTVVASNVGGIPLQIQDGINGFLCESADYKAFADRIVALLKDPSLGEELGRAAKETVKHKFLITRLVSDYLDLIIRVLG